MKFCVLMGSPRIKGNTAELLKPFIEELEENGSDVTYITLADKTIHPCDGCYACQNIQDEYGCVHSDDANVIINEIIAADCIVFGTPIYTWYCTAPMKALLDRYYGLNKFYGSANGSLWEGKKIAIVATHGYDVKLGTEPFEMGIKNLCQHSKLDYLGMYSIRDDNDLASFQTPEAIFGAKQFARKLLGIEAVISGR